MIALFVVVLNPAALGGNPSQSMSASRLNLCDPGVSHYLGYV